MPRGVLFMDSMDRIEEGLRFRNAVRRHLGPISMDLHCFPRLWQAVAQRNGQGVS